TPLHYAVMYGNYEMTNYLINTKCDINIQSAKNMDLYKSGSTPYDLAIQLGQGDIINLLAQKKAKKNLFQSGIILSDQSNRLSIFIDLKNEKTKDKQKIISVKRALATELKEIIKQKACPTIIIGQHLLRNALQMACSLKDWVIVEIEYENIRGYLIIPNQIIGNTNIDPRSLDSSLKNLGFDLSKIQHSYINESDAQSKQINQKKIDGKTFSELVPSIINYLLTPKERFVYWIGHGNSGNDPTIGNLSNNDASKLLTILAQKNTKIVYISSCFFGGKNFKKINDFSKMTIISGATTEITTRKRYGTRPINWTGFFNGLIANKNYTNNNESNQYLANQVLPFLTTSDPDITNFPHIKNPGDSSFTLLNVNDKAVLINQEAISRCKTNAGSISVDNKQLLEIDINQKKESISIAETIKITNKIPLLISNCDKNIFEQIYINALKDVSKADFINIIEKITKVSEFNGSEIENIFLIKELSFPVNIALNIKDDKEKSLPKILHNVLIQRGPGSKCDIFFSANKKQERANSFYISYDNKTNSWNSYPHLSDEEFALYQELLTFIF
ncbi:MAG: ankyrin repeat domain-containing protein, partial [bacterium]